MTESDFQIFECVGALVVVLDGDNRIIYWNRPCSDLTGYALQEVRGRRLWDFLLAPEEVEPVKTVMAQRPGETRPTRFANYWVTKTGERRWIDWSHTSTTGPDGRAQYFIKTGIDGTERKQLEDALRTSEARLSGIIGVAGDAIISIDDEQRIVIYNEAAEKIFGWSAAEVMGKPLDMVMPERFRGIHAQHIASFVGGDVVSRGMGQRMVGIFGLRKNGEEFPAQAAISKLEVGGKRLFTVVLRDVTAQARRQKARELMDEVGAIMEDTLDYDETLTRFARLVVEDFADCCAIDLVDTAQRGRRIDVLHREPSKSALCATLERISLRPRPDLVSAVIESRQPQLLAEVSSHYLESIAESDADLRALQELDPQSVIVAPLLARGQLLGALVLVSTQRSHRYGEEDVAVAEELARRAALVIDNARLYEHARRAMHDLLEANGQMVSATIRAQELAEEAEAARARTEERERELRAVAEFRELFIGILGHDLRNPIASIAMAASVVLRHRHVDEEDKNAIERIVRASQRMNRMIYQLLDLTRARLGGGFPLERKPTDLREVCRAVVDELAAPIRVEVEGDLTGLWDPDRLVELLTNITGNAVEHAAPGTTLLLRAHAEGADVVIEVSNQGDPIPPEVLPSIFEPFRRAKQHEKSATGNLGLGLYIAKQIVLSHGGTIDAHSAGGTTTFAMRLPRHQPHSEATSSPPP